MPIRALHNPKSLCNPHPLALSRLLSPPLSLLRINLPPSHQPPSFASTSLLRINLPPSHQPPSFASTSLHSLNLRLPSLRPTPTNFRGAKLQHQHVPTHPPTFCLPLSRMLSPNHDIPGIKKDGYGSIR
ncbi:hypothetical protein K469DRAFT_703841 [Zopfia rhizophila CBS 207.26]|uniref:Uncharacterized protein n=1 Tax=Zopfia rhizophila CBS 207.26 TaxID=1314779 RepID=A0A6A6EBZ8_9PEZI|nr:hypothetical protein K469DRAFT_703841 [Zopfia rhizophila CBS 207.26]